MITFSVIGWRAFLKLPCRSRFLAAHAKRSSNCNDNQYNDSSSIILAALSRIRNATTDLEPPREERIGKSDTKLYTYHQHWSSLAKATHTQSNEEAFIASFHNRLSHCTHSQNLHDWRSSNFIVVTQKIIHEQEGWVCSMWNCRVRCTPLPFHP